MRFNILYRFMVAQLLRSPMIRVFVIIVVCGLGWLGVVGNMPSAKLVEDLCFIFVPVYFTVALGSAITERTERHTIELLLVKPFSRRDIVVADYLSVTSIFGVAALVTSAGLWFMFGLRSAESGQGFVALFLSLQVSFMCLYSFIQLSGLLLRNAAVVVVIWVGYLYVGAASFEVAAKWIAASGSFFWGVVFMPIYFLFPRVLAIYRLLQDIVWRGVWDVGPAVVSGISAGVVLAVSTLSLSRRDVE